MNKYTIINDKIYQVNDVDVEALLTNLRSNLSLKSQDLVNAQQVVSQVQTVVNSLNDQISTLEELKDALGKQS